MSIVACGINHKTAPLSVRERFSFLPEQMSASLQDLMKQTQMQEVAIISTCNRVEIYSHGLDEQPLLAWLEQYHGHQTIMPYAYSHRNADAVKHLLRVASGLDSMVLGESQILGQLKTSFHQAVSAGTVGPYLHRLFQYVFSATKQVRTQTGIGVSSVSLAYCAVDLAKRIFSSLQECNVLVVGAGETIELVLRYLQQQGLKTRWIANRTFEKATQLAQTFQGVALELNQITEVIANADIVVTATSASLPLIGKGLIERAIKLRRHRPMLLIDLGVPRNIEPECAELEDIYHYTVDDLHQVIEAHLKERRQAAVQAEAMITLQTEHFMAKLAELNAAGTISDFRRRINQIKDQELFQAKQLLHRGVMPEEVLSMMAHRMVNKILHQPTVKLRESRAEQDETLLLALRDLFQLDEMA